MSSVCPQVHNIHVQFLSLPSNNIILLHTAGKIAFKLLSLHNDGNENTPWCVMLYTSISCVMNDHHFSPPFTARFWVPFLQCGWWFQRVNIHIKIHCVLYYMYVITQCLKCDAHSRSSSLLFPEGSTTLKKCGWSIFWGCLGFLCQHSELKGLESLLSSYHRLLYPKRLFHPNQPAYRCCLLLKNARIPSKRGILTNEIVSYNWHCSWRMVVDVFVFQSGIKNVALIMMGNPSKLRIAHMHLFVQHLLNAHYLSNFVQESSWKT